MTNERQNSKDEGRKTFTFSKTGTLPTLERLLGEMASLEEQTQELEVGPALFYSFKNFVLEIFALIQIKVIICLFYRAFWYQE